jgi:hypothetical protein
VVGGGGFGAVQRSGTLTTCTHQNSCCITNHSTIDQLANEEGVSTGAPAHIPASSAALIRLETRAASVRFAPPDARLCLRLGAFA